MSFHKREKFPSEDMTVNVKSIYLLALVGCAFSNFGAITTSFEGGLPEQWSASTLWQTAKRGDIDYLCTDIKKAALGTTGLVKSTVTVPEKDLPSCDNVCAEVILSNVEPSNQNIAKFQFVVSTNNWQQEIPVGEPFAYYDSSKKDEDWVPHRVTVPIAGLKACSEFHMGLKVLPTGWTSYNIHVKSISFDFLSGATCTDLRFAGDEYPQVGEKNAIVSAKINKEPISAISDLTVWAVVTRNGFTYTNQMFQAEDGSYTNDVITVDPSNVGYRDMPPIDAGDKLAITVVTKYASSMNALGEPDELPGRYIETSEKILDYTATQLGSVWINEFSLDQVEICGTTNRHYIEGWALELVDADSEVVGRKEFGEKFNFTSNMPNSMIGLLTYPLGWHLGVIKNPYSLRLINAADVVEHLIVGLNLTPSGNLFGKTGTATWPEQGFAYDWSGTASDENIFRWGPLGSASFGRINEGQFFEVKSKGWFQARTFYQTGDGASEGFEFANVRYQIDFSSGRVDGVLQTGGQGLTPVTEFTGAHTNEDSVPAVFSVSAFGWAAESNQCSLAFGVTNSANSIEVTPSVAWDDFSTGFSSGELEPYWLNSGDVKDFYWAQYAGTGLARVDLKKVSTGDGYAELKCQNPLKTGGKRYANISFSVRNDPSGTIGNTDYAYLTIATDKGFSTQSEVARSISIINKVVGVTSGSWNWGTSIVKLPDDVDESTPLYAKLRGEASAGWSNVYLDVTDIRIAFQDMVTIETNGIENVVEGAIAGSTEIKFNAKLEPWATDAGVSNVAACVVYSLDEGQSWSTNYFAVSNTVTGVKTVLTPDAHFQLTTSTNVESVVEFENPLEGWDSLKYYYVVDYFADNRDPDLAKQYETRYWPDNAKIDEKGRWICEALKGYEHGIASTEIEGIPAGFTSGGQEQGTNSLTVTFRLHDEGGIDDGRIVIKKGETEVASSNYTAAVIGSGTKTFTGSITAGALEANTSYSVEVTGNNGALNASSNFWTLATAAAPTIVDRSASSLKVKADGCKATKIKFSCDGRESGWLDAGSSYEFTGLAKFDQEYEVTVAVQNGVGAETPETASASFWTMPTQPTGNVEVTPGWDYHIISVANITNDEFGAFGNPSNTAYAFFVENVGNDGKPVATNWLGEADGRIEEVETPTPVWMTLANWDKKTFKLSLTTTETNKLYLVAGGREPIPGGHVSANGFEPTLPSPEHIVKISLVVEKDGEAERVAYDPNNHEGTYGFVTFTNKVMTPFENGADSVAVAYEFTTNNGTAWHPMTLKSAGSIMEGGLKPTISGNEIQGILADTCASNIVAVAWNAAADLVFGAVYDVEIRATIKDDYHSSPDSPEISLKGGKMDLQPPVPTIALTKPALVNGSYTHDTELNATVGGAVVYKWKLADGWSDPTAETTISKTGLGQNGHTLAVVGRDEWGNWTLEAKASATNWIVDTVSPTAAIAVPAAGLAKTNNLEFIDGFRLTMDDANFKEPTLSADSFECVNCTIAVDAGSGKNRTFKVTSTADGEVKFRLKAGAFLDWANNSNTASGWLSFVSDRTPPKVTVDCAVALTNASPIAFKVTLEDANLEESAVYLTFDKQADQFEVGNGSIDAVSGSGTNYIVKVVPSVENGQVSLKVKGNAFKDVAGNDSIESNVKTVEYDCTAPAVTVDCAVALTNASPIVFTVTVADNHLNEGTSYLTGESQFTIVNGSWDSISGKGANYVVKIAPNADGKVTLKVNAGAFKDEAGNDSLASDPATTVYDHTPPTVTVVRTTALTNGVPVAFKVMLADSQTNLVMTGRQYLKDASQFTFGPGCELDRIEGTEGTNYVVWVKRTGDGDVTLQVNAGAFKDEAGNDNAVSDVQTTAYDSTAPAVTVSCAVALTNASPIVFTVTVADNHLNEGTSYLTGESQFTIVNGSWDSISGKGANYVVKIAPNADGKVTLKVNAGAFKDEAGNDNTASEPAEVVSDRTAPTATVVRTTALTNGVPVAFKVMLADSQTNLVMIGRQYLKDASQFTFGTGCELDHIEGTAGTNYVVWVKRTGDGDVTLQVNAGAFKDEAGNDSIASDPATTVYDHTPPTATVVRTTALTNGVPVAFRVTLADSQTNLLATGKQYLTDASQFTVGNGCAVSGVSGEGTNYVVLVTRTGDGEISLKVNAGAFKDEAGNDSVESNLGTVTYDGTAPAVTVSCAVTVTNASPIVFTVTVADNHLNEGTSYLTGESQFTIVNGSWNSISGKGASYVVKIAPNADGKVTLKVNAGAFKDEAGNDNTASEPAEVVSDRTAPTATVVRTTALTNGVPVAFKVMLADSQTNLVMIGRQYLKDASQFTFGTGCELDHIEGAEGTNYVVWVKRTGDGDVTLQVNAGAFKDEAGNDSIASDSATTVYDHTAPKVTIAPDGAGDRTFANPIPFKITVIDAHAVTELKASDFTVTATNENGVAVENLPTINGFTNINGGNTNYTFTLDSPAEARREPIMMSVAMNPDVKVVDAAGNSTSGVEGRVVSDRTQPEITLVTDVVSTNKLESIGYTLSVSSFSPITNDLKEADIRVPAECTVVDFKKVEPKNDRGVFTNYSFAVSTPTSGDTLMTVSLPAGHVFNSAGNSNEVAFANTVMSDHTAPVPMLSPADALTNNLDVISFEIAVAETNGLAAGSAIAKTAVRVVNDNGSIQDFASDDAYHYSFKVLPDHDGEVQVQVDAAAITDFAGNDAIASSVLTVVSDRTPPTAALSTATDLTRARNEATIDFTVTLADSQDHLSAESNYLSAASFVPGNYTVDSVTGQGKTYTATIRPTADGPVSVGVTANAFFDLAGNGNSASAVTNFVCDRTAPTIRFNGENTKGRHFEMVVSATDTPATTKDIEYKWSVVGGGQTFGNDWTMTETNKEVTLRGTGLNDGAWNWTVQFRDVAGNVATTNGSWAVKTDEAPELELTPTSGTVNGSATEPLVFTLKANGDLKLTEAFKPDMVQHVSRDQVFYRQVVAIASDSLATITLTPVKQDRDFTDEVTLTVPCGAATGTNGIAAATLSGTVTYKFSGTNKNPETVRIVRTAVGYLDDPHRTNENLGEITLFAKTVNGAKFAQGLTKESVTGASLKSVAVAADGLSAEITLTADAQKQLVDIDGWKGFNLVFAGGSVESLPSPIAAGAAVKVLVKVWRNLARVAGANGAAIKVDEADAPLAHDGDARTAPPEGSSMLAAKFPRARVNSVHIRLSAASAKSAYKPTQATVTLKSAGKVLETFVTDLVWDGKRCAPVDLLVTPQDMLVGEAIADEATLSFTGSTAALYLDEFAVFGIPEAVDPLCPEILSVNPVEGGFVVQTGMGVSNWVKSASQTLELESAGVLSGVGIEWANIDWADAAHMALKVPVSGQADAGYVGGVTLRVKEGFLSNFIGRSNVCETISTSNAVWNSGTVPEVLSFNRYAGAGESVAFGADAIRWELILNQPVLNISAASFNKHSVLGAIQVLGTDSPTNYIVRAQLNCWTNAVSNVTLTLKEGAVQGLTGKSNAADKASDAYKLEEVVPVSK